MTQNRRGKVVAEKGRRNGGGLARAIPILREQGCMLDLPLLPPASGLCSLSLMRSTEVE